MTQGQNYPVDQTDVATLLRLVLEQQRGIRDLIEDLVKDTDNLKLKTEDIAVIKSRLETLEKLLSSCQIQKGDCQTRIERTFAEIVGKREVLFNKISSVELELTRRINDQSEKCSTGLEKIRSELDSKIDNKIGKTNDKFDVISTKTSYESGKYGALAGIVTAIILFIAKALWEHVIKK
jgi:hypothetical protein